MSTHLLPLGSVVRLAIEGLPLMLVMGFYPSLDGVTRDYLGTPVPSGLLQGSGTLSFDHGAVKDIVFEATATDADRAMLDEYSALHAERDELLRKAHEELAQREARDGS